MLFFLRERFRPNLAMMNMTKGGRAAPKTWADYVGFTGDFGTYVCLCVCIDWHNVNDAIFWIPSTKIPSWRFCLGWKKKTSAEVWLDSSEKFLNFCDIGKPWAVLGTQQRLVFLLKQQFGRQFLLVQYWHVFWFVNTCLNMLISQYSKSYQFDCSHPQVLLQNLRSNPVLKYPKDPDMS